MSNFECLCKKCGKTSILESFDPYEEITPDEPRMGFEFKTLSSECWPAVWLVCPHCGEKG